MTRGRISWLGKDCVSGYAWMEFGMTELFKKVIVRGDHSIGLYYSRLCCLCRSYTHVGMIKGGEGRVQENEMSELRYDCHNIAMYVATHY